MAKNKLTTNHIKKIFTSLEWDNWPAIDVAKPELLDWDPEDIRLIAGLLEYHLKHAAQVTTEMSGLSGPDELPFPEFFLITNYHEIFEKMLKDIGIKLPTLRETFAIYILNKLISGDTLAAHQAACFISDFKASSLEGYVMSFSEKYSSIIKTGEKVQDAMAKGRENSAINRSKEKLTNEQKWHSLAIGQWRQTPGWTNKEMAKWIKKCTKTTRSAETIINSLKGLKSTIQAK